MSPGGIVRVLWVRLVDVLDWVMSSSLLVGWFACSDGLGLLGSAPWLDVPLALSGIL